MRGFNIHYNELMVLAEVSFMSRPVCSLGDVLKAVEVDQFEEMKSLSSKVQMRALRFPVLLSVAHGR